jgi:hypothetical protein
MHGLRLVFPPAAAAILWFPVNEIPNILQIRATMDVYDLKPVWYSFTSGFTSSFTTSIAK